jgi:hypothetical protein
MMKELVLAAVGEVATGAALLVDAASSEIPPRPRGQR